MHELLREVQHHFGTTAALAALRAIEDAIGDRWAEITGHVDLEVFAEMIRKDVAPPTKSKTSAAIDYAFEHALYVLEEVKGDLDEQFLTDLATTDRQP